MNVYSIIEKHLMHPKGAIGLSYKGQKLAKRSQKHKFNWTKEDIVNDSGDIESFIRSLPERGFGDGTQLYLRIIYGTTTRLESTTTLKFKTIEEQNQMLSKDKPSIPSQTMQNAKQHSPPQMGAMGYASVPHSELINLKVQEQRFIDLQDKLRISERELDDTKSELRQTKDKLFDAERKLDTLKDRHELELERKLSQNKKFYETEAGQAMIGQLAGKFPDILETFKQSQSSSMALGNPMASFSEVKQQFVASLTDFPDQAIAILNNVKDAMVNLDGFYDKVLHLLSSVSSEN